LRFRVLALDYDGTIAQSGKLDPETGAAIREVRKRGISVVLVTGRILDDLRRVAGNLSLFDAVVFSWVSLALYYSNGFLAAAFYGAQSRVMDGSLARANCLLITTLWSAFKFVMVPIGAQIGALFPPATFAMVFLFVWGSYTASDASSEIVGSLFGKQKLRVWGMGDVNRKSIAGTWAAFLAPLGLCLWGVFAHQLPTPWLVLAVVIALSNAAFELLSPRGTDDFTMATANALICWAFGLMVY